MNKLAFLLALFCGTAHLTSKPNPCKKKPKNIIFMIGDGMGLAQLCAGYALNGKKLNIFEAANIIGLCNTSSADDFITDSAAGATAFSTGFKTHNGMIGFLPDSSSPKNIFELAKKKKMATGIVASCAITHATPAAFFSHQYSRNLYSQITEDFYNRTVDIAVGGGFKYFDTTRLKKLGYEIAVGNEDIKQLTSSKYVGFYDTAFHPVRMTEGRGPFLQENSIKAAESLKNKKGFIMMIEGSQIDWGGHLNDSNYVVQEMLDFDNCVQKVLEWANEDGETLVIITADHETGGLGLMGGVSTESTITPNLKFHNTHHSGIMVPVFSFGPGSERFQGVFENTEIFYTMKSLLGI